ncbi:MAG: hypothetical protein PHQ23_15630 [Candidatus Wallbacteria bacterium]|nr:hypothetical protein [Candidatus Wallbacteria bacterium]
MGIKRSTQVMKTVLLSLLVLTLLVLFFSVNSSCDNSCNPETTSLKINEILPIYSTKISGIICRLGYDVHKLRFMHFGNGVGGIALRRISIYKAFLSGNELFTIALHQPGGEFAIFFKDFKKLSSKNDTIQLEAALEKEILEQKALEVIPAFFPDFQRNRFVCFRAWDYGVSFCRKFNEYLSSERVDVSFYAGESPDVRALLSTMECETVVRGSREAAIEAAKQFMITYKGV